jgi:hypothetical protein
MAARPGINSTSSHIDIDRPICDHAALLKKQACSGEFRLEQTPLTLKCTRMGEVVGAFLRCEAVKELYYPILRHNAGTDLAADTRGNALSLAKSCSMGLRSGIRGIGRQENEVCPARLDCLA